MNTFSLAGARKRRSKRADRKLIFQNLVNHLIEEEVFRKKEGRKGYPGLETISQHFLSDQKRKVL